MFRTGSKAIVLTSAAILLASVFVGCGAGSSRNVGPSGGEADPSSVIPSTENARTAVFAGGCFWCMEEAYEKIVGVIDAVSGYAGGETVDPTYYDVTSGKTGHTEVVQVIYDPEIVSYTDLLNVFWRNIDLLDGGGQFCDRGSSYRTAVFYVTSEERTAAEASKEEIELSDRFNLPIATEITELQAFYRAEEYHQNYYVTDAVRYKFYKSACGRVRRLEQLWGDEAGGTVAHR